MNSAKGTIDYESRLKEALLALQKMRTRIESLEKGNRDPIAVIGIGCRFPGQANDPDSYWQLLQNGVDAIRDIPPDRWDVDAYYDPDRDAPGKMFTRQGGFIDDVGHFDPHFFGISPREARSLDPQQRLLLEVAWEALENAGQSPESTFGSRTGVFVGVTMMDYLQLQSSFNAADRIGPYRITGNMLSSVAGRVSYTLGLRGPAMAVDTACSSSLVAIYLAVQSLLTGDSDMVLAGGVNLMLTPEVTISACKANMLSTEARCKTFDSQANGFIRSEGCGVVVLKRLSEAIKHGDRIMAVIRGAAMSHDGFTSGFTVPSKVSQEAVIKAALQKAGVTSDQVGLVETHGTGTSLGDPIEVRALAGVYGVNRTGKPPLRLGAVKTNLGHLEAASGIAGLIKVVLSLQNRTIPPNLHLRELNPHLSWNEMPFEVPTRLTSWEPIDGRWLAGVSSFGASGMNAHVILEAAPQPAESPSPGSSSPQVLCLSAKSEAALQELADRYIKLLSEHSSYALEDICFTANVGRSHFKHRLAVTDNSPTRIIDGLLAFKDGQEASNLLAGQIQDKGSPKIAFLFTGHGSQYIDMGRSLYESNPVFRQAFDECSELLVPYLEVSLLKVVYPDSDENSSLFEGMKYTQPALFALEYALAKMWNSWGIELSAVMGHSVGEYVAACIAGVISLPDAVKLVAARGRMMDEIPEAGAMAVVFASEAAVEAAIAPYADKVAIAVINSADNIVISGEKMAVEKIREELRQAKIRSRILDVAQASHSPMIEPILDAFGKIAAEVSFSDPEVDYISCLTGDRMEEGEMFDRGYWRRHLRHTVRFGQGMERLHQLGCEVFIEIGPSPVLLSIGKRNLPEGYGVWLPSLRKERSDWEQVLGSLAELYTHGVRVDWEGFYRGQPRKRLSLPTYPFQRQRYWIEPGPAQNGRPANGSLVHPLLGARVPAATKEMVFENHLTLESQPFLADHSVRGQVILPGTAYIEMALAAAGYVLEDETSLVLEDILLQESLPVSPESGCTVQILVSSEKEDRLGIKIFSLDEPNQNWKLHMSCQAQRLPSQVSPDEASLSDLQARISAEVPVSEFYQTLLDRGLDFGPSFQGVSRLWVGKDEVLSRVDLPAALSDETSAFYLHPALLDAGFQPYAALLPENGQTYLPFNLAKLKVHGSLSSSIWSHVTLRASVQGSGAITADIRLFDETGRLVIDIEQLTLLKIGSAENYDRIKKWLYEVSWQPAPAIHQEGRLSSAQIAEKLQPTLSRLSRQPDYIAYQEQIAPQLSLMCSGYIQNAFIDLGWSHPVGSYFILGQLVDELGVAAQHRRLLARLLEILSDDKVLEPENDGWIVRQDLKKQDLGRLAESILAEFPDSRSEVILTRRFGESLAQGLRGEQNPLELLFSGGSLSDAESLYRDAPFTRGFNELTAEAVAAVVESRNGSGPVRILEIGAGTGGTTEHIISALKGAPVEYTFTDISPLFLHHASKKFAGNPAFKFKKLDIEQDPGSQDDKFEHYDLVLAANVLHATRDLRQTLKNVQSLLAPGGLLLLLEGTQKQPFIDLVFGLTEGWWRFADTDLRPSYALLSANQWLLLLAELGFAEPASLAGDTTFKNQALLIARQPVPEPQKNVNDGSGRWLVFANQDELTPQVCQGLEEQGNETVLVRAGDEYRASNPSEWVIDPKDPAHFNRLLSEIGSKDLKGVLYLWSLAAPPPQEYRQKLMDFQEKAAGSLLYLTQSLAKQEKQLSGGLWLVTRGVQPVSASGDIPVTSPASATLWGMGKVIIEEHPELNCVCLDLGPQESTADGDGILNALRNHGRENQIALRGENYYVPRLVPSLSPQQEEVAQPLAGKPYQLVVTERGALDNLNFQPLQRIPPGPGEVEIQVYASALAFRDVLNALGMYPGGGGVLGSECAGIIVDTGPGVEDLKIGDEVVAVARGCFASHVVTPAHYARLKPDYLNFAEAASIPSAFFTAAYALHRLAQIKAGDRVLIHAAAGGVGIAAVQLALRAGAEVYATAGNPEKRALVKALGAQHVMDSRSLAFSAEIMTLTGGQGVDIVLNSLADEFIQKSIEVLAENGCFLEIGKRGIWSHEQFAEIRPQASYHVIDLLEEFSRDKDFLPGMFQELLPAFKDGMLKPLPIRLFSVGEAAGAFRYMAQAKHIGKIVLDHGQLAASPYVRSEATYLIAGGLGGLGLEVARWLVKEGARFLALAGRSAPSPESQAVLAELENSGAKIKVIQADISVPEEVDRLITAVEADLPPLRGVIHSAGSLDDGILVQQNWERFAKVFRPKLVGSWSLYQAARQLPLDFFVLFSSGNAQMGSPGQANHVAACTFQDSLSDYLHSQGVPILNIGWGPWAEIGAAAGQKVGEHTLKRGVGYIYPEQGIQALEYLMNQTFSGRPGAPIRVMVAPVNDILRFAGQFPGGQLPPFYDELVKAASEAAPPKDASGIVEKPIPVHDLRDRLLEAPPSKRMNLMLAHVQKQVIKVLGLEPSFMLNRNQPIQEMGLDSLMAVELRNLMGSGLRLDHALPATLVFDYTTTDALANYLLKEIFPENQSGSQDAEMESSSSEYRQELDGITDEEAQQLLLSELDALRKGDKLNGS